MSASSSSWVNTRRARVFDLSGSGTRKFSDVDQGRALLSGAVDPARGAEESGAFGPDTGCEADTVEAGGVVWSALFQLDEGRAHAPSLGSCEGVEDAALALSGSILTQPKAGSVSKAKRSGGSDGKIDDPLPAFDPRVLITCSSAM